MLFFAPEPNEHEALSVNVQTRIVMNEGQKRCPERTKNYLMSQTGLSPIRSEIALNDKRK